jgi:hypothetical protein
VLANYTTGQFSRVQIYRKIRKIKKKAEGVKGLRPEGDKRFTTLTFGPVSKLKIQLKLALALIPLALIPLASAYLLPVRADHHVSPYMFYAIKIPDASS